jgi:putative ABC transport system permease protein
MNVRSELSRQRNNNDAARPREQGRGMWTLLEQLARDVRYGIRSMLRTPGLTAIIVLTLAVGIGATTAIFSAVNPILFQSLPYPDPGQITMIWELRNDGSRADGTFGMYRELVDRNRSFEAIAVFRSWQPTITGEGQPERFDGQRVSASYFQVMGVPPVRGRDFEPSDDQMNGPNVIIISDNLWRRRFGGDQAIIGRQITLDGNSFSVVGVMPRSFENVLAPSAELWVPMQYGMSQGRAWGHHLRTVGRLKPGVTTDQATQELNLIGPAVLEEMHPPTYGKEVRMMSISLQDDITRGVKPALLAVLGAVILVLVIACVNVTNLLLARGVRRRTEFAMRSALGAGRGRLIQQLLTESVVLALMGGLAGMLVAMVGVRALVALSPPGLPRVGAISVDATVFAFGLGITTLIGLAFGLTPALHAARTDLHQFLQQGSRRTTGGLRRTRNALVVAEVALALVLLISSGLLFRSLERLLAVAPGFNASQLITMQVQTIGPRFGNADDTRHRLYEQTLEAIRKVPGVAAAALTSQLPLSGDLDSYGVHFESSPTQRPDEDHSALRYGVSPGYFQTMGIALRSGRLLDERDRANAPLAAVINESYAKRQFPGMDPIGQRLRIGQMDGPLYTVVGVVDDVKQVSLALDQSDAVYTTPTQWRFADRVMSLVVRTQDGNPAALTPTLRRAIWSVDKDQPVTRIATMEDLLAASAAERRFVLILFEAFAIAALVLATAGIYGVLAGSVAERTHEIGVRMALGASRARILALVGRQGMMLTGLGVAIGLAGAFAASQAIAAMLFGVSPLDPVTYIGVVALLAGVAVIACGVPAWRAARVDPAITLRAE